MTWKSNPTRQDWTEGQHIYITAVFLFKKKKKDMLFSGSQFVALFLKKNFFSLCVAEHKYVETGNCVSGGPNLTGMD